MRSLNARVSRLEDQVEPVDMHHHESGDPPQELLEIIESLSPQYQALVVEDLNALTDEPPDYVVDNFGHFPGWAWGHGVRRLTAFALQMTIAAIEGRYTGRLTFTDEVARTCLDTYKTCDRRPVGVTGDYCDWNRSSWGKCSRCGYQWWNAHLYDALSICPGCDAPLPVRLSEHDFYCVAGSPRWLTIPAAKVEQVQSDVRARAIRRLGIEGAEEWIENLTEAEITK